MHTPPFVRKNLSRNSAKIRFPELPEAPALFISDSFRADQSQLPLKLVKPFLSTSADLVNSSPIFANFPLDIRLSPSKATGCILASLTICTLPAGAGFLCRKSALKHFAKEMVPWSLSKRLVCLTSGYRSFMISLPVFQRANRFARTLPAFKKFHLPHLSKTVLCYYGEPQAVRKAMWPVFPAVLGSKKIEVSFGTHLYLSTVWESLPTG